MLWSALVFADYGSQMQLATALVINLIQLLVMVHFKPFGGAFGDEMNFLNGLAVSQKLHTKQLSTRRKTKYSCSLP